MCDLPKLTLFFKSLNDKCSRTILLLHGLFSSHHEFQLLLSRPELQHYHILIPDLPRHGQSTELEVPFNLASISALLADLIASNAKGGKADVVGGDLGGYVGMHLASKYPERVSSLFVTGCERSYASNVYANWVAVKTYLGAVLGFAIPRTWLLSLLEKLNSEMNVHLIQDMEKNVNWRYTYSVFQMLHQDWGTGKEICAAVRARTLIIAAGRQDSVGGARERGIWLRTGQTNTRSRAVVVQGARHAWILQLGKVDLFAKGVVAWVEDTALPSEFEDLTEID